MFAIVVTVTALCCVGFLVYIHAVLVSFPPKAKMLCDIWAMVEDAYREKK
jgi:hypothetical protein